MHAQSTARRYGPKPKSVQERFESFLDRQPGDDGCWLWTGNLMAKSGYGRFTINGRSKLAHRSSYILHNGPIADYLDVAHLCDVRYPPGDLTYRRCVNPAHLAAMTNAENHAHAARCGRGASGERQHALKGELAPSAVLTATDVREIRRIAAAHEATGKQLGERYGVSAVAISKIILRKSWKHVE